MLLREAAQARAVPRVTRRALVRILGAMAGAAEPVQDAAWNAAALRHLQGIAMSLHFYSSLALTQAICRGEVAAGHAASFCFHAICCDSSVCLLPLHQCRAHLAAAVLVHFLLKRPLSSLHDIIKFCSQ